MGSISWDARQQPDLERFDDVLTYLRARYEPQLKAGDRVSLTLRPTEHGQPGAFVLPLKHDEQHHFLIYYLRRPVEITTWCFREEGEHPQRQFERKAVPWTSIHRVTVEGQPFLDYLCQLTLATPEDQIVWGTAMALGRVLQGVQVEMGEIRRTLERLAFQELCCWQRWSHSRPEPAVC